MRSVLVWLMVFSGGIPVSGVVAAGARAAPCQPAELFATDNTAVRTDPGVAQWQDGPALFETQARSTLTQNGEAVMGSTPLEGVSWSPALQRVTYERSREFHLCGPGQPALHAAAEALRRQFGQHTVLTFGYLPPHAPGAGAVIIAVPGVDVAHFRDALVADPDAHTRLPDGSVTGDHTLILVAGRGDLDIARRLVDEAGGSWDAAMIACGTSEVVAG